MTCKLLKRDQDDFDKLDELQTINRYQVSDADWKSIKLLIDNNCFWTMQVVEESHYLDGTIWTLEGFDPEGNICSGRRYHVAGRVSPNNTPFSEICEKIISYEPINIDSLYTVYNEMYPIGTDVNN